MAVSFSADYLYQGAKILSRSPGVLMEEENMLSEGLYAVARAVYSLGVFVIAPLGMLYHGSAASIYAVRTCLTEERDVVPLNQLMEQHWEAAGYDAIALMVSCTGLIVTAGLIMTVLFPSPEMIGMLCTMLIPMIMGSDDVPIDWFFLFLGYGRNLTHFDHFLPEGKKPEYASNLAYHMMVKAGMAIDQPLTPQEATRLVEITSSFGRSPMPPAFITITLYRFLIDTNKVDPAVQARAQALVAAGPELTGIYNDFIRSYGGGQSLRQMSDEQKRAAEDAFTARIRPILEALPPIGAPVPAPAQPAAQAL